MPEVRLDRRWVTEPFTEGVGERGVDALAPSADGCFVAIIENAFEEEDLGLRGEVVVLRCSDGVEVFRTQHHSAAPIAVWEAEHLILRDGMGIADPVLSSAGVAHPVQRLAEALPLAVRGGPSAGHPGGRCAHPHR